MSYKLTDLEKKVACAMQLSDEAKYYAEEDKREGSEDDKRDYKEAKQALDELERQNPGVVQVTKLKCRIEDLEGRLATIEKENTTKQDWIIHILNTDQLQLVHLQRLAEIGISAEFSKGSSGDLPW